MRGALTKSTGHQNSRSNRFLVHYCYVSIAVQLLLCINCSIAIFYSFGLARLGRLGATKKSCERAHDFLLESALVLIAKPELIPRRVRAPVGEAKW